ncbi:MULTISPECIES: type II toxin-antitoxin system RelE/ParE family toxin [unclassified Microcoleus]|jgi:mRNA-degrading endonuclease RelE of RelBE toxin-antitoxin system|uniref:type II toxin-antitoxin system RelE family toxin n=1 Tax=unclassified Microcoleus TaxID=2642155 RepID=UPI001E165A20|nr:MULTISPECIES: type II toxin-antitoxin system RelE/ParE family toxin [unclassified Microcoleus]MCC3442631.1 type II toxin-antitoxin system RelE/ParE family toxin [Microcoleus sp. PH2017_03_ELD_O_A]MCC3502862.1 type II toxin-antitoxin system RelE/ParE family toxin [Microcoleus sp. PH2017_19_SFW_U_A]MCC3410856.1 type II toxin-antitoxin system RelE/ParE family toxin [Microcoleus sp. PH2017_02_FOX_O_A]MCC3471035.1 type II toxin-antitoxin system RelE/ParE family toxin [Microcoleus sp. PH2017_13_LA
MYQIEYTPQAIQDIKYFKKHEQQQILSEIPVQLRYEPSVETRNRKRTRPNSMAEWELRIAEFRVFYNVEEQVQIVEIQRIGEKEGNTFLFRGQQEDV